jgi:hypothetical protein
VIENAAVRPPTHEPSVQENEIIRQALAHAGLLKA